MNPLAGVTMFSPRATRCLRRCGIAHRRTAAVPRIRAMDFTTRRHGRGFPMSRYIAASLLALAAALITAADFAFIGEQAGSAPAAFMVRP